MLSPIGQLNAIIRKIKMVREYQDSENRGNSSFDHISCGCIFALLSIIAGSLSIYLYWLYLGTFIYHVFVIEIVHDTWIKKKNSSVVRVFDKTTGSYVSHSFPIDWPKVWSQVIERTCGFVFCLPILFVCLLLS